MDLPHRDRDELSQRKAIPRMRPSRSEHSLCKLSRDRLKGKREEERLQEGGFVC